MIDIPQEGEVEQVQACHYEIMSITYSLKDIEVLRRWASTCIKGMLRNGSYGRNDWQH